MPWTFPAAARQPVWWNDETAVYALDGTVDPIIPLPPRAEPFPFGVRSFRRTRAADDGPIAFTATFDDRAPDQWTSQDWVLIATASSAVGRADAIPPRRHAHNHHVVCQLI